MNLLPSLALAAAAGVFPGAAPNLPPEFPARLAALEQARAAAPSDLRVLDALAGSYTMAGDYEKALAVLDEMRSLAASDADLAARLDLRRARNLAWSGDAAAAIRAYEAYRKLRPADREAAIELLRLRRFRGDYAGAEALCNELLKARPDDAEVLALKAEVLHWAGHRRRSARRTAERAAYLAPELPDARVARIYALWDLGENRAAQREFTELAAQVASQGGLSAQSTFGDAYRLIEKRLAEPARFSQAPAYSVYNDSDGIRDVVATLRFDLPVLADHKVRLDLGHYRSSAPLASVFSAGRATSLVNEFAAGGTVQAAPGVDLTLLGGASRRSGSGSLRGTFDVQLAATPVDRWTFDLRAAREFLKVTPRAIDRDLSSYQVAGGATYAFDSRTSLSAHAERRYWSDQNRSLAGQAVLRRVLRYQRPFMIDGGVQSRWEHFRRDTRFDSGFFTPDQYLRQDGFLGLHGEAGQWLTWEARAAGGAQKVARGAGHRSSWEFASSATFRLTGTLSLYASYQRRNYSLLAARGWYQGFYLSLGIRP